jgi:hypothetical protein
MTRTELESFLGTLGIPAENAGPMAEQLEKRARQLAEKRNQSYEEALAHLVNLLKQGWAAKERGQNSGARSQKPEEGK